MTVRLPAPGPIAGALPIPGALPAGFAHPHASAEARRIAEAGLILRVQVGSGVHGTAITGSDDRDEMGLCLEPPQFVTGLARVPNEIRGERPPVRFEQYERHTAWDRPGGVANRSGAELAANAHRFVSRLAASRYLGYLQGQKAAATWSSGLPVAEPPGAGWRRSSPR